MDALYAEYGIPIKGRSGLHDAKAEFEVKLLTPLDLAQEDVLYQADSQIQEEILKNWDCEKTYDVQIKEALEERFGFVYPYEYLKEIPVKVSVSELKKRSYAGDSEREESLFLSRISFL